MNPSERAELGHISLAHTHTHTHTHEVTYLSQVTCATHSLTG